jgi:hypothetical protein
MAKINRQYLNDQATYWLRVINVNHSSGCITECNTEFNELAQWFVKTLVEKNIPFKILNMGAGIKKITTDVNVCPKCKGLGKC